MKNRIVFLLMMLVSSMLNGQTCDIYITELNLSSKEIFAGDNIELTFGIKNNAKGITCSYPEKSVRVYLFFPEQSLTFSKISYPSGGRGEYFDWTYDAANNAVVGLNHRALSDGQGETAISIALLAPDIIKHDSKQTIGLSIVQNEEGDVFPANDHANDNMLVSVNVRTSSTQSQPVLQLDNSTCGQIGASVTFLTSGQSSLLELWRSASGYEYELIDSKKIDAGSGKVTWNIQDKKGLEANHLYTYRLIEIKTDGSKTVFSTMDIIHDCMGLNPDFQIYPNPAMDKAQVFLGGNLQKEEVQLDFRNSSGELVKSFMNVSKANNALDLSGLPSGLYVISIHGNENVVSKKFIKLEH